MRPTRAAVLLHVAALVGLGLTLALPRWRPDTPTEPRSFTSVAAPLREVEVVTTGGVDASALRTEDARRHVGEGPVRYAVPVDVAASPTSQGRHEPVRGGRVWRVRVRSDDARTVSVGLSGVGLPDGAELWFYAPDHSTVDGPYTAETIDASGELWSDVVEGDTIVVELFTPHRAAFAPTLEIDVVNHDYVGFGPALGEQLRQGSCNVDVACDDADPWRDQVDAVAVYTIRGAWMCTGTLLDSSVPSAPEPLFLTAFHCGVTPDNAHAVRVYWNYESPHCGQRCCGSVSKSQYGARLLARHRDTDFALLELDRRPLASAGVFHAGWDAREDHVPLEVAGIHHPSTDEKAIAISRDPLRVTPYLAMIEPGDATHWRVDEWEVGTTEPGSSGSGLFDESGRLVGQLHGGHASCSSQSSDWYGRLSRSWEGGGTPETRLRDWLDPLGTGVRVRDGRRPAPLTPESAITTDVDAIHRIETVRPNPTKGKFVLTFELVGAGDVELRLFSVSGREYVRVPVGHRSAGEHLYLMDNADPRTPLSGGVYFLQLLVDDRVMDTTRLIVLF